MSYSSLELLEDRIAPSSLLFVNAKTATYTDVDGDHVTVSFSKSILSQANLATLLVTTPGGLGDQLRTIDLGSVAAAAAGAKITVTAKSFHGLGDGYANVGAITATGIDLGMVNIHGDLGQIQTGADTGAGDIALKGLSVHSMLRFGLSTGAANPNSEIRGSVGAIAVASDMVEPTINVDSTLNPVPAYSVAKLTVGGSSEGSLLVSGSIGPILVRGSLTGGTLSAQGKITSLTVVGDITGNAALDFYAKGGCNSVTVDGSIDSSDALFQTNAPLGSFTVKGSVLHGLDLNTSSTKTISIRGSTGPDTDLLGYAGSLGKVSIGGDFSGQIDSAQSVASIKIGGSANFALILVGHQFPGNNPSVFLGSLQVKGDWIASNLTVGTGNLGADDAVGGSGANADNVNYGNGHDVVAVGSANTGKVNSIVIGGEILGTEPNISTTDHFGFVAVQIGFMKVDGVSVPIDQGGATQLIDVGTTGDVDIHKLGFP